MVQELENSVQLHNNSDVAQHIFFDKRRETIYPRQTRAFPRDIARQFLEERGQYVRLYVPTKIPQMDGFGYVWIANATGNPFLPKTVALRRKVHGKWEDYEKDNPLRNPFPIKELISRGQTVQASVEGEGEESLNHPKVPVEIPPFERVRMPHPIAEVLKARDDSRDIEWRGQIAGCRPPGDFEPNETWSYDDIRLYAALMDGHTFLPLLDQNKDGIFPPEAAFGTDTRSVAESKKKLLEMLFFRFIDERFAYPSKEEFAEMKKREAIERQRQAQKK